MSDPFVAQPAPASRARPFGKGWSADRVAGGLVLAAWALLFWFLLLTGRDNLYLSMRTAWVVPVGATLLTAASLGRLASARGRSPEPLSLREAWILGLVVVPVVLVMAAQTSREGEAALAKRAGAQVEFVGFVTRYADTPAGELLLTRYIITCCVADATIAQVRVVNVPPGRFQTNDWIDVEGTIYPLGHEVIVNATDIQEIPRPSKPYITP
jgi:hypothetical protein